MDMDQSIINGIQHLQLTKEEEESISISNTSRSDLIEECALSLFGRLLADRHQNMRALKSTLRSAWKMGQDLRIVDVGNGILQFKFNSKYQMEWVERNGPWNFDNNLLLLCRWTKGLSVNNISFTHSPFWIQVWGLPFESMSEEVGRDLGNSLGKYIESDKRSWLSEQAKYMRIRVDLPINKPLRRGSNIVNQDGGKFWVTFKYERLPSFCFHCGLLGHDEKHCNGFSSNSEAPRQYGDWLRANGGSKSGPEKARKMGSDGFEVRKNDSSVAQQTPMTSNSADMEAEQVTPSTLQSHTNSENLNLNSGQDGTSDTQPAENPELRDKVRPLSLEPSPVKHARDLHYTGGLGKEAGDESSVVGRPKLSPSEAHEVTSPLKAFKTSTSNLETTNTQLSPIRENWKRVARAQGKKLQNIDPHTQNVKELSGSKRPGRLDFMDEDEGTPLKKLRDSTLTDAYNNQERSAVAAEQHRRKQ